MVKRVKRMVEMESKIREREIEVEKREIEEREKTRLEEEKKTKEEKERLEKRKEIEEREKREKAKEKEKIKLEEMAKAGREQLIAMQEQMKVLLGKEEVKMPQVFDGTSLKVSRFVEDCRRYMERKMKEEAEEDKICWIVSYVQGDRTDKWKERIVDEMFEDR